MDGRRRRSRATVGAVLAGAVSAGLLSGCGSSEYEYVASREHNTVFRVPSDWSLLSEEDIESELYGDGSATADLQSQMVWNIGYDASTNPDVSHIIGQVSTAPAVYARVSSLTEEQRAATSFDAMRNMFFAVTAQARETATTEAAVGAPTGFELLRDDTVTGDNGERGVHVQFNYTLGMMSQTFDQTVYVDEDTSHMYVFLVRCTTQCFKDRKDELDDVIGSFTVKK